MTNINPVRLDAPAHPAIREFAEGIDGERPAPEVVDAATRITQAAIEKTVQPEISVDVDGALSFDLRLASGLLLMAELSVGGALDAGILDDARGAIVEHLPHPTVEDLIRRF